MNNILKQIHGAKSIGITGHIGPDGDCVGSCMSLYNYLLSNCNGVEIDVYLESVPKVFSVFKNIEKVNTTYDKNIEYDVFITLDCAALDRIGLADKYFKYAKQTICIDHHISNTDFADKNHIVSNASSTCEILYTLFEDDKIDASVANSLYTGIICDTGVFKHSNTSEETMNIAGRLISKGVKPYKIIDELFYNKTYTQNQILGRCLLESIMVLNNKCIVSSINKKEMDFYGANSKDLEGIIDQLRVTEGIEVAILLYETDFHEYKVSMRANDYVDVSKIATYFGGGGHIKASGCTMRGSSHDVINNILKHIEVQLVVE